MLWFNYIVAEVFERQLLQYFCSYDALLCKGSLLMKKILLISLMGCFSTLTSAADIHWSYDKDISPKHWGELSESFKVCSTGKNQTPININNTYVVSAVKHKIDIEYEVSPHDIVFNGHTVQVNTKAGDHRNYLELDNQKFFLKQFHFHTPSENQIKGKSYPLELHFVNANAEGQLTVLAVMFELGRKNSEWDKFWADLSHKKDDAKVLSQKVDLEKLLPEKHEYYRFSGSLTTPPCSEGVNWIVLKQPLTISAQQLNAFKKVLKNKDNNRPLQPVNGRVVVEN